MTQPTITLTDAQTDYLRGLARKRNAPKLGVVRNRRHAIDIDDERMNLIGLAGEYAVSQYLGLPLDTSVSLAGDGGVADLRAGGYTIQVKTNTHAGGDLYFNTPSDLRADIAVLVIADGAHRVRIAGWVWREEFQRECLHKDWGYGPRVTVSQSFLRPVATLKDILSPGDGVAANGGRRQ